MAVVYKISCLDESVKECYIGSTVNFRKRIYQHKHFCHNENSKIYNLPLYKFIRENGGFDAWTMTIIDSLTTIDKNEILKCERRYVEEQKFRLNKEIPSRTMKEYMKEYQKDHKEEIVEYYKQYREANRETLNKKNKQYYLDHKEEMAEYKKQYREANREAILKRNNEKVQCERCGAFINRSNFGQHKKSKKCMNAI